MKKSSRILMIIVIIIAVVIVLAMIATVLGFYKYSAQNGKGLGSYGMAPSISESGLDIAIEEVGMKRAAGDSAEMATAIPIPEGLLADEEFIDAEQRIIKNGNITAKVDNAEETAKNISELATRYEGFVQSSNIYESSTGAKSGTIIIRIPVAKFEAAFSEIKTFATQVVSESVSGQDVTEEYIDIQSRIKNKRAEEEQYLDILNQADTVEDILMVTERLNWVRQEIERLEGRLNYLENLTDMSTITTFISEEEKIQIPVEKWRPIETIRIAFRAMIVGLQSLADVAIWILMFAALIALPIGVVIWIIVWIIKKIRRKKR
jgi:hypothetical protein